MRGAARGSNHVKIFVTDVAGYADLMQGHEHVAVYPREALQEHTSVH
jgi:hypothetical protein